MAEVDDPVILDTDVASLAIKGRLGSADARLLDRTWCVTFVTVGELVKGASMAQWDLRRRTEIADWLRSVVILPYDIRVSDTWGCVPQTSGSATRGGSWPPRQGFAVGRGR